MTANNFRLPAEWERHAFTQMAWPSAATDWDYMLDEATACFTELATAVATYEPLLIVTDVPELVKQALDGRTLKFPVIIHECPINDTWTRDTGAITVLDADCKPTLVDFQFNGWGLKFAADKDNQINAELRRVFFPSLSFSSQLTTVLEGGSIESDGNGTILTTRQCLFAPNRNEFESEAQAEVRINEALRANHRFLWLTAGHLDGDDTDGHVDTLARLMPGDTIAYVKCYDKSDDHFEDLDLMEQQIKEFRTADGKPYNLLPLPMTPPIFDPDNGERIPATYANFYFVNGAILMPTYAVPTDDEALEAVRSAFPDYEVVGVDCRALIRQHGSLHCSTMQFPEVVPVPEIVK